MKQKQRGSDKQRTKVKVTLKAKEIEIKGKRLELEPFVETVKSGIERIPENVSEAMGIPLTVPEIELFLFDKKGFKEYISELSGEEYKGHYIGFYYPGKNNIPLDIESGALALSSTLEDDEKLDGVVLMAIATSAWHEIAHMVHDLYDKKALEKGEIALKKFLTSREGKITRIKELIKKENLTLKESYDAYKLGIEYWIIYANYIEHRKNLAFTEGVARWTEREVIRKNIGKEAAEDIYGIPKQMKLSEKIKLSHDDEYFFGYRFFEKISQMTDANVIRLAIQHNPTYVEMLYPQLYILRMKAALLI